jgi:hypothetical protein
MWVSVNTLLIRKERKMSAVSLLAKHNALAQREEFICRHSEGRGLDVARPDFLMQQGQYVIRGGRKVTTGYLLMPTGAKVDTDPLAQNLEPPPNPKERLRLIIKYRRIVFDEAYEDFIKFKELLLATFTGTRYSGVFTPYPGTEEEGLDELHEKQKVLWNANYALKTAGKKLEQLTTSPAKAQESQEADAVIAARRSQFTAAVNKAQM